MMTRPDALQWWQRGSIYHVYPRSFQDANGDGIGDLPGITGRLEYCRWLGCDAVWLSPIYPSPMADFGYDVADHTGVDPRFGTLDDFDRLMAEARRLGLRILMDYVPNHTSEQHPWFVASRSSRHDPHRHWYVWRDPAPGGGPPNNWLSVFGGSSWTFDPTTGQYYLHSYLKEQPDLNWRNPEVERAMLDVMRFWLERGVHGFRIDSVSRLVKDAEFRDNPPNPDYRPGQAPYHQQRATYSADRPDLLPILARMRQLADRYADTVLLGEAYLPAARLRAYYGEGRPGLHFPFNFQLIRSPWDAAAVGSLVEQYEAELPAGLWPNWVLGNHDNHRVATRIGRRQARVAAMLLLTLRGTPVLYYGDEIGMVDVAVPADRVRDPWEKNVPGLGLGRDPERSPMQWDAGPHAGFSTAAPWLPVAGDHRQVNVALQREDPRSMLSLVRALLAIRAAHPALFGGRYVPVPSPHPDVMLYRREAENERFLVALNFGGAPREIGLGSPGERGSVVVSTLLDRAGEPVETPLCLRPDEGLLLAVGSG